jgi:cullin-associated NEDD8-dissociated protein 1
MLNEWYISVSPLLISRLNEREESVRLEVFAAWEVLLRQTTVYGESVGAGEAPTTLKRKRLDSDPQHSLDTSVRFFRERFPIS